MKICLVLPKADILPNGVLDLLRQKAPCKEKRCFVGMQLMGASSVLLNLCTTSDVELCKMKNLLEILGDIIVCAEDYCTYAMDVNGVLTVVINSDFCPAECEGCIPWLMAILYRISKLGLL